jgi:ferredoxin-NADP reductase/MOSC domain-containing protein YiiM
MSEPGDAAGKLVSVNVGVPRDVPWQGKTVRTAIWKHPVAGPRTVRRLNIDGDDQADRAAHGGEHRAVFVYQLESYRYWQEQLGREDFSYGQFGENFTVAGLADDEVCIGDRYRIGEAIFEVTQPRVTCFRVGIRMDDPRMPSLLVAHHRPGFYLRVIEEGAVEAGDEIVKLTAGPEQLTVAEVDALLYLPQRSRRTLERALRIPALSEGWQGSFRELLDQGEQPGHAPPVPAWSGFRPFTVAAVTRESSTITSFRLVPADGHEVAPAAAGQYLTVRLAAAGPDRPSVIRSYSLSATASEAGYRISVKLEPEGVGSGFLHRNVHSGDTIDVAAPRGSFVLRDDEEPIVLISAGVGATPVLAMLQLLASGSETRQVWWIHAARNGREHAFGHEVDGLLAALPHAHRLVAYSRPDDDDTPGGAFDRRGRITIEAIDAASIPRDANYYLCGPESFMRDIAAGLTSRGVRPERVATETFGSTAVNPVPGLDRNGPAPHQPDGIAGPGPAVTFSRSDLTVPWDPGYASLLELAEACDVPVGFGCRTGVCHSCESGLLTGEVEYRIEPLERPADGRVLMCCVSPATELTLEL